jgi:hypothetical protein
MLRILISAVLLTPALGAAAQTPVTDAFGITASLAGDRAAWAGMREVMSPDGAVEEMVPSGPAWDVLLFLGAKSIVAGGDPAHAVALILDRQGNLVADGTEVTLEAEHGSGTALTRRGIATRNVQPGLRAGLFHAGASTVSDLGLRQSPRAEYRVTADLAAIRPQLEPQTNPALPESFSAISTALLTDSYGNSAEDGTALTLVLAHRDGAFTLVPGISVAGRVEARILTRDLPGDAVGRATLLGAGSDAEMVRLSVPAAAAAPRAEADVLPDVSAIRLRIGPFATSGGYLLNDGSRVTAGLYTATGETVVIDGWLLDGMLEVTVPLPASALPIRAEVTSALGTAVIRVEPAPIILQEVDLRK